jgi:hypothetical protein
MSVVLELYKRFPEENWNHAALVKNHAFTYEFIKSDPKLSKEIANYLYNPKFDDAAFKDNLHLFHHLYTQYNKQQEKLKNKHSDITKPIEFDKDNDLYFRFKIDDDPMKFIERNIKIMTDISPMQFRVEEITKNIEFPWNPKLIFERGDIPLSTLLLFSDYNGSWFEFSKYKGVTPEYINANPDIPWDWNAVCMNKNITWAFILENLDKDLNWDLLSQCEAITMDIITDNPQYPWNFKYVVLNPNLTVQFVIDNYEKGFDFYQII